MSSPVGPDTPITIKVVLQDSSNRRLKLPLKDLGPTVLPDKLRLVLAIPAGQDVKFERFSDSAGSYVTLDPENPQVYKTLFRAAKAKLKLRLRVTVPREAGQAPEANEMAEQSATPSAASSTTRLINNIHGIPVSVTGPLVPAYNPDTRASIIDAAGDLARMPSFKSCHSARAALKPLDGDEGEAPVPRSFPCRENFFAELASISRDRELALRMKEPPVPLPPGAWSVYCNSCDKPMADEHYHCSICDDGDYDLCEACVNAGIHCPGESHWMIKRFVKGGKVINSTTERSAPKPKDTVQKEMPGAYKEEAKPEPVVQPVPAPLPDTEDEQPTRTCNSCVKVMPESEFVTCMDCWDYDLCISCHVETKHGHHPGHAFKPVTANTEIGALAEFLCAPGRNVRHAAICDGCDKAVYGVRHKCLNCPDWDYCSQCVKNARYIHPGHRFVPIYDPLSEPRPNAVRHHGIYCDGPLCSGKANQTYIEGVRYKCAVCDDTDFCANCEALPTNRHNRTHPLIKFKTPVRNVSVTTMGEDKNGATMAPMGDHRGRRSAATETIPAAPSVNAATQVQTVADVKPSAEASPKLMKEKIEIKDLLTEPLQEKIKVEDLLSSPIQEPEIKVEPEVTAEPEVMPEPTPALCKFAPLKPVVAGELNAHFIRDTIPDGTKVKPEERFTQVWTLRNPGPCAWPAGCSVRYIGGDNMLNVEHLHPSSATDIAEATESNVVGRAVEVGEEISFRVLMKAPKREGTSISYWRLKAADGTPFGHRLWCHIEVLNAATPVAAHEQSIAESFSHPKEQILMDIQRVVKSMEDEISSLTKAKEGLAQQKEIKTESEPSETKTESETSESKMIFPKLEKESPSASTHEAVETAPQSPQSERSEVPSTVKTDSEPELFEDAESVEFLDGEESDSEDGFLTDEEYDILDASDEELP